MKQLLAIFAVLLASCAGARTLTGIEVLRAGNFAELQGKRVGLITNPTGVDSDLVSTIDILHAADGVHLAALFAPEHGVRGDVPAGAKVKPSVDKTTGVKIYSLYGATKTPTASMLEDIDIMVYDMQDIGCRSYTFISTLGRVMKACVAHNVPLLVLDRPNPLGGLRIEGPMNVSPDCKSFVSEFDIPYIYGLTPGELALYFNATLFDGKCSLDVVAMNGWKRAMTFNQTGLPWIPTSPNIPTVETAFYYPALGILGELGVCSIGANFTLPFRLVVSADIDADRLAHDLTAFHLPGVKFRPYHVKINNNQLQGVQVHIVDEHAVALTPIQFYVMQALDAQGINPISLAAPSRVSMFNKVCGSTTILTRFKQNMRAEDVLPLLTGEKSNWLEQIKPYLLYD